MKLIPILGTTLMGIAIALAGPVIRQSNSPIPWTRIPANTAVCVHKPDSWCTDEHKCYDFWVQVGRPFIGGAGSTPIQETLNEIIHGDIQGCICDDGGFEDTRLFFMVTERGAKDVNEALQWTYREVPFRDEGYCKF